MGIAPAINQDGEERSAIRVFAATLYIHNGDHTFLVIDVVDHAPVTDRALASHPYRAASGILAGAGCPLASGSFEQLD